MQPQPDAPDRTVKPRHFDLRISLLFAAIFVSMGIHLPYFPLWLEHVGFSAGEIAVVLAAPMFARVATTPLITAYADRASDRVHVLVALLVASLFLSFGYFLTPVYAVVLSVSLVLAVVWSPLSPLADSLALSGVRRFGSDYASMRLWGSASFLAANLGGGMVLQATGAGAVPGLIAGGLALALVAGLFAPRLGRPRKASPLSAAQLSDAAPSLMQPWFLFFVAGTGIVNSSHGFLFGFVSIYWSSIGIGETVVGVLWAWAVVAEVIMFIVFRRVFTATSAPMLIMLAAGAAVLRWLAFPLIDPSGFGVAGFLVVQSLHAFTTGLILIGVQKMIAENVGEERTGAAQGIAFFANGCAMAAVTLASGPLYQALGVNGFFVMAAVAVTGAGFIWAGIRAAPSAPERGLRRRDD